MTVQFTSRRSRTAITSLSVQTVAVGSTGVRSPRRPGEAHEIPRGRQLPTAGPAHRGSCDWRVLGVHSASRLD